MAIWLHKIWPDWIGVTEHPILCMLMCVSRVTTNSWPTAAQPISASSALWSGFWSSCWEGRTCLCPPCTEWPSSATTRCTSYETCSWVWIKVLHRFPHLAPKWSFDSGPEIEIPNQVVVERCWETYFCLFKSNRLYLLLPNHLPGGTLPSDQHLHHLRAGTDWHALFWRDRLAKLIYKCRPRNVEL